MYRGLLQGAPQREGGLKQLKFGKGGKIVVTNCRRSRDGAQMQATSPFLVSSPLSSTFLTTLVTLLLSLGQRGFCGRRCHGVQAQRPLIPLPPEHFETLGPG